MGYAKAPAHHARTSTESAAASEPAAGAAGELRVDETLLFERTAIEKPRPGDMVILPNRVAPEGVSVRWSSFSIVDAFITESRELRLTEEDRLERLKRQRATRASRTQ